MRWGVGGPIGGGYRWFASFGSRGGCGCCVILAILVVVAFAMLVGGSQ